MAFYSSCSAIRNILVVFLKNIVPAEKASEVLEGTLDNKHHRKVKGTQQIDGGQSCEESSITANIFKLFFRPVGSCPHIVNIALKYKRARILCLSR